MDAIVLMIASIGALPDSPVVRSRTQLKLALTLAPGVTDGKPAAASPAFKIPETLLPTFSVAVSIKPRGDDGVLGGSTKRVCSLSTRKRPLSGELDAVINRSSSLAPWTVENGMN